MPSDDVKKIARDYVKKAQPKTANVKKPKVSNAAEVNATKKAGMPVNLPASVPDSVRDIVSKYLKPSDKKISKAEIQRDVNKIVKAFVKKTPGQAEKPKQDTPAKPSPKLKDTTTKPKSVPDDVRKIVSKTKKTSVPGGEPPKGETPPIDGSQKYLTFFDRVKNRMRREGVPLLTKKARGWMKDKLTTGRVSRQKLIADGPTDASAIIGNMYFFFYDAKHKKTLPYWDKFPLIFPLELYEDGLLGMNLHYLDRTLRMRLFDKLLQFKNNERYDEKTKIKLSYALLADAAQYPEVRPCIKRYLGDHVKSQFMRVHPSEWEIALFLPVEAFQKKSTEYVWKESRKIIRKARNRK